ncbi:Crp/Fnr family transcriptional regulator [Mucilaginibacter jinjuensis]|uniref:Crp/Fnr family transcriptional regulator n=1 Tax=Mucilaginibacter jinjuensis TaxID=1176721 RepID=A0ABY7TCD0_9SPHI|nr:Crp/Fnr family transcriptional regulator [Mucilaginibacter jinjuensis]WCT12877.1 Crp/Fnr family transcriptional regulator [Mucilaginibacter jinjuensis]
MLQHLQDKFPHLASKLASYENMYHRIEVPAKTVLLHEGDVSKKAWQIEKGCIRAWFNNKGRDLTLQFFFEGQNVSSLESFRRNIPSVYTLETIEPSIIYWINKKDWEYMLTDIESTPEGKQFISDITLDRQLNYMRHFMSFIRDTPKERFINLMKERPEIIKRVPQHYIASYLGITSVSLSRIRSAVSRMKEE